MDANYNLKNLALVESKEMGSGDKMPEESGASANECAASNYQVNLGDRQYRDKFAKLCTTNRENVTY